MFCIKGEKMKYGLRLLLSLLTINLFSGCDIDHKSDYTDAGSLQKSEHSLLKIYEEKKQHIIGEWQGVCYSDQEYDESYQAELTLNPDLSFSYIEKIYSAENCIGDSYSEQNAKTGLYKLGKLTQGDDGKEAYEFEIHTSQNGQREDKYFMVRFTTSNLIFTDENFDNSQPDGKTPQTRNNHFREIPRIQFTKKPIPAIER